MSKHIFTEEYDGPDRRLRKWLPVSIEFVVQMAFLLFLAGVAYQRLGALESRVAVNENALIQQYQRKDVLDAKLESLQNEIIANRTDTAARLEELRQQMIDLRNEVKKLSAKR